MGEDWDERRCNQSITMSESARGKTTGLPVTTEVWRIRVWWTRFRLLNKKGYQDIYKVLTLIDRSMGGDLFPSFLRYKRFSDQRRVSFNPHQWVSSFIYPSCPFLYEQIMFKGETEIRRNEDLKVDLLTRRWLWLVDERRRVKHHRRENVRHCETLLGDRWESDTRVPDEWIRCRHVEGLVWVTTSKSPELWPVEKGRDHVLVESLFVFQVRQP